MGPSAVQEHTDADKCEDGEEGDGEGQRACRHVELLSLHGPVDGSHGPGQANAQEDIDGVAACDVANRGICIHVLDGGSFAGKRVWRKAETNGSWREAEMRRAYLYIQNAAQASELNPRRRSSSATNKLSDLGQVTSLL